MDFWWRSLGENCIFVAVYCDSHRIERTRFVAELYLRPKDKTRALLEGFSTDLITNMEAAFYKRYHYYIVTIEYFSK